MFKAILESKYRNIYLGIGFIIIVVLSIRVMLTTNQEEIYKVTHTEISNDVVAFIEETEGVTVSPNELNLTEQSFEVLDINTDSETKVEGTVQVTLVYDYDGEKFKTISVVEETKEGINFSNWTFAGLESIQKLN
ncbi:hypothetical protein EJF36_20575 [Bacillus sp. HMF5848]|uniref:hypothetical protein n=1 Tax=Bacillus sp. HMF5848 TaxID=2495421 RepID=UPI000F770D0B|nr:hypothetical protein [Bacillus sp. HMF5848]RSK29084.1 hypothetical protein EJF36_20575 [Bacillus sp. HMF5848]